ncbi:amino acid ABC transporter ATP-binding protein [Facklamia sp. DSM 111018]|uniref:Amino acid ABC transporter ATP-binding protein n=1 Tax=Facklamia lactis TaxID=2749967 RepID=A0ABS0LNU6_9LACT|nr:ATP-binding cassette domain-containing protein [Facklamia lactis]MBG9979658.1 amino acid ABC transporter ATP-binding protein [Facklamia lactis]MBG9985662.1 amino acid ABC transporter ATP-binding protein [Facklamia lactis]
MSLQVSQLSKQFGSDPLIDQFDLKMEPGDITLIIGASGSGKTTFLRILNYLESADQGDISLGGYALMRKGHYASPKEIKAYQQQLGLVFQDFQLFPNLTVLDNLLLPVQASGGGNQDLNCKKAEDLLQKMGLSDKVDFMPGQLSGGQKQRVAIARAMMLEPILLCFDEPTSALDAQSVQKMADLLTQLADQGMMILIITHDPQLVEALPRRTHTIHTETFKPSH